MKDINSKRSLVDHHNRTITYLRVSLTQRCNMKCSYCFGSTDNGHDAPELSNNEIIQLIKSFALLGINKIRFTGGEPLLRRGIVNLVKEAKAIDGIETVGLTTNGFLLDSYIGDLVEAGLDSVNISLDSLKAANYSKITGVNAFARVMAGMDMALDAFLQIKLNTVVMRGVNDDELADMAQWALERNIDLRFIEFMPTGKSGWNQNLFVSESQMRQKIGIELVRCERSNHSPGPAVTYQYQDFPGRVSFISAVSQGFCTECNRLRLTSRGEIFGCLFQDQRIDLLPMLRRRASIDTIARHIADTIARPGFRRAPGDISITGYQPLMQAVGG